MTVTEFHGLHFRNLREFTLRPHEQVNIFYGDNAQGKTNLLEALWLCTGARSFRGAKEGECVAFSQTAAALDLSFIAGGRDQKIGLRLGEKKEILLNGVKKKSLSELSQAALGVIFAPNHLGLIKDGPAARRDFLDFALGRLKPTFTALCEQYERALDQRNALLRDPRAGTDSLLDLWEDALARLGSLYARQRQIYVERVTPFAVRFYHELSGKKEQLALFYDGQDVSADADGYEKLKKRLEEARAVDRKLGYTTVGPHRHDLLLTINGNSARSFGSQGQQRSAALALKLAEAELLSDYCGETPLILLDDVMSELDGNRQDYLLNKLEGRQIFITCCDPASFAGLTGGKVFHVQDGGIHEQP